jgi:hypothetical protein
MADIIAKPGRLVSSILLQILLQIPLQIPLQISPLFRYSGPVRRGSHAPAFMDK